MIRICPNLLMLILGISTTVTFFSTAAYGQQQSFEEEVRKRAAIYKENGKLSAGDQMLCGTGLTLRMIELDGFKTLWNEKNTQALFSAIESTRWTV